MIKTANEKEYITDAVKQRMSNMGTPTKWFQDNLGMAYNTFQVRLEKHNWSKSEILALKQLSVI